MNHSTTVWMSESTSPRVCVCVCPGGAVVLAPVALGVIGFTSAGIAAGSLAASMMSAAAVANGGAVAAGGLVAVLQSAGRLNTHQNVLCAHWPHLCWSYIY